MSSKHDFSPAEWGDKYLQDLALAVLERGFSSMNAELTKSKLSGDLVAFNTMMLAIVHDGISRSIKAQFLEQIKRIQ